jgi:L-alanine-DL-glutamate epimerase-like enolase superfamily enzyme
VARRPEAAITGIDVRAAVVPTDFPESDGTFEWDRTTVVLARVRAGGVAGLGYGYADPSTARLARDALAPRLVGRDALDVPALHATLVRAVRNLGRPGIASMAISVLDTALWDVKARLLGTSLGTLLGATRDTIAAYGSGGFTSYDERRLADQLGSWTASGLRMVKMKVGRDPDADPDRVRAARAAIGPRVQLFVDANGAYRRKQALALADRFAAEGVTWFEEPVSSDDLAGLRLLRDRAPTGMDVAAGEYGYDVFYFRRMLEAGAVDVLQADATRCGGVTGFLAAGALAAAFGIPLSAHCAPALHVPLCCALPAACHIELFHDHVRIERLVFEGAPEPRSGALSPDPGRLGLGLDLVEQEWRKYETTV